MEELKFCRICFSTNGKFYEMEKYNLISSYQGLAEVIVIESLPQLLCSFCLALLRKFIAFKQKCIKTQNLLHALVENKNQITKEVLEDSSKTHNLGLPYTILQCQELLYDSNVTVKNENDDYDSKLNISIFDSDDVPVYNNVEYDSKFDSGDEHVSKIVDYDSKFDSDDEPVSKTVDYDRKFDSDDVPVSKNVNYDSKFDSDNEPVSKNVDYDSKFDSDDEPVSKNVDYESKLDISIFDSDDEPVSKNVEEKLVKKHEELEKCEEKYMTCEENGLKEIKNECKIVDDTRIFEESSTDFDSNDESDDKGVKKKEKSEEVYECFSKKTLTKAEQLLEIQDRKKTDNYKNSCYKCDKCFKGYINKTTYDNHMAKHDDPVYGSFICDICHVRTKTQYKLNAHKLVFHQELFTCNICFKVMKTRTIAKLHSKWHAGVTYNCQHCDMKFNARSTLQTHLRLKHPSSHCCQICGASFINSLGLQFHTKRMHLHSLLNMENEKQPTTETTCATCKVNFHNKDALLVHIDTSIDKQCDPNTRSCVECGSNFNSMEKLQNHQKIHHDTSVKCSQCNKILKSGKSYKRHFRQLHLEVNNDHVCEICGTTYRTKNTLIAHQRKHTGEKPFACSHCPKKFTISQLLQCHLRTHTGETPYKCALCPKAFKQRGALNTHNKVHTGLRPHSCPLCDKSFSQLTSMKMHVRGVHLKLGNPYKRRKRDSVL